MTNRLRRAALVAKVASGQDSPRAAATLSTTAASVRLRRQAQAAQAEAAYAG